MLHELELKSSNFKGDSNLSVGYFRSSVFGFTAISTIGFIDSIRTQGFLDVGHDSAPLAFTGHQPSYG
jgi:hypothetical protein